MQAASPDTPDPSMREEAPPPFPPPDYTPLCPSPPRISDDLRESQETAAVPAPCFVLAPLKIKFEKKAVFIAIQCLRVNEAKSVANAADHVVSYESTILRSTRGSITVIY